MRATPETDNQDLTAASPPPQPGRRLGPRPLLMHLALATLKSSGSARAWPSSSDDWQNLINALQQNSGGGAPGPDAALIHGIAAYRRHPWVRDIESPAAVWTEGESVLRDFGGTGAGASVGANAGSAAVLLVPSLVNRASILDLSRDRSMARALAAAGLRVFLLDWGWPDAETRQLDLDAIITGRLARAIAVVGERTAGRVTLAGYCMGGLLTVAAAQLLPQQVAGLALLATPWDFHAGMGPDAPDMRAMLDALEPLMQITGTLPVDMLQAMFSLSDLHGVGDKYRAFGQSDQTSARARQFVSVEDWLNDGVPLAAPVARHCLRLWYGENAPARGIWTIGGEIIAPHRLRLPSFAAIPGQDRIVPPDSASALAAAIPDIVIVRPKAGHIGMVAGRSAPEALWAPLAAWATGIPAQAPGFRRRRRPARLGS